MPRKPGTDIMDPETPKRRPRISVLDRRLQNPFGSPSAVIAFKEPGWTGRWFNAAIITDKIWRAKNDGWQVVMPEDVVDLDQIGAYDRSPAGGHIVRGERGQEVLMKMPTEDYRLIQHAKARVNNERMGNPHAVKQDVVEAAGRSLNAEAADYLNRTIVPTGQVTTQYERVQRIEDE